MNCLFFKSPQHTIAIVFVIKATIVDNLLINTSLLFWLNLKEEETKYRETNKKGINIFKSKSAAIIKGENIEIKWWRNEGLNEFNEDIFPVPKNAEKKIIW